MGKTATKDTTDTTGKEHGWRNWLATTGAILLVLTGSLALGAYLAVRWAERQILTTDNWVAMVAPLPKQKVVSDALSSHITSKVFTSASAEQRVAEALPDRAAFLAGPLTSQLESLTTRASQKVVASDGFQSVWITANTIAHGRLIAVARGETPPLQQRINERFDINLSGAADQLRAALGGTSEAIPGLQPAARPPITISADLRARRERLRQTVQTADYLAAVLPSVVIASMLGGLALARDRRRMAILGGVMIIVIVLLKLVAIKALREDLLDQVRNPGNLAAVGYIYDTIFIGLKDSLYMALVVMLGFLALCVAFGPAAWAMALRSFIRLDRWQRSSLAARWHRVRAWVAGWQGYMYLGIGILALAYMALFMTASAENLTNALLMTLAAFALIRIIATPRRVGGKET